mgnify:FL=1
MFAVVQIGPYQYKVGEGDSIETYRLQDEVGKKMTLDKVLLFANGSDIRVGQPFLKEVKILAEVREHSLGEKTIAFKFHRRKRYAKTHGGRRQLTTLNIAKIEG